MRTAWLSSVIFSFIAVIGVGALSFFLINDKPVDERKAVLDITEPFEHNSPIFTSDLLPKPGNTPSTAKVEIPKASSSRELPSRSDDNAMVADETDSNQAFEKIALPENKIAKKRETINKVAKRKESINSLADDELLALSARISRTSSESGQNVSVDEPIRTSDQFAEDEISNKESVSDSSLPSEDKDNRSDQEEQAYLAMQRQQSQDESNSNNSSRDNVVVQKNSNQSIFPVVSKETTQIRLRRPKNPSSLTNNNYRFKAEPEPKELEVASRPTSVAPKVTAKTQQSYKNLLNPQFEDSDSMASDSNSIQPEIIASNSVSDLKEALLDVSDGLLSKSESRAGNKDTLAIIVNRDNHANLSLDDLKNIYTDKIHHWDNGRKITMYNLPVSSAERELFSRKVLRMTALEAATAESNRVITNSNSNRSQTKFDRLVVSYVARDPQAIGYVPLFSAKKNPDVRIVMTME